MVKRHDAIGLLEAGLRAASLRQSVIASNLANMETPGFRRGEVQFESILADAMKDGASDAKPIEAKIVHPGTTPADSTGNDVNVDMEVGDLVKNDVRYKTFVRMMAKLYQQMDLATQGV
jgi:flagellar basal-body rod protein FlgB